MKNKTTHLFFPVLLAISGAASDTAQAMNVYNNAQPNMMGNMVQGNNNGQQGYNSNTNPPLGNGMNLQQTPAGLNVAPFDALVLEDGNFKKKLDQGKWGIEHNFPAFEAAQELAFKRGHLQTLIYLATHYGLYSTPRFENHQYEPMTMVETALNILNFTNSPILRYVAQNFISTLCMGKMISELSIRNMANKVSDAQNNAWIIKTPSAVTADFIKLVQILGTQDPAMALSFYDVRPSLDAPALWSADKEIIFKRMIHSLLKFTSSLDAKTLQNSFCACHPIFK